MQPLDDWQNALNNVKTTVPYPNCLEVWLFDDKYLSVKDPSKTNKKRPVLILHNNNLRSSRDPGFLNIVPLSSSRSGKDRFTIPITKDCYSQTLNNFNPASFSSALTLHYQPVKSELFKGNNCYCVGVLGNAAICSIRHSIAVDVLGYKSPYDYDLEP